MAESCDDQLLHAVKEAVHSFEPDAEIILFGSRARGDVRPESDWDFLLLLTGSVDDTRKDRIRHALYEVEWERETVISALIISASEWTAAPYRSAPIFKRIAEEGVRV